MQDAWMSNSVAGGGFTDSRQCNRGLKKAAWVFGRKEGAKQKLRKVACLMYSEYPLILPTLFFFLWPRKMHRSLQ